MKYDWETEIRDSVLDGIDSANCDLPDDFVVMGIAVANVETGEACLIHEDSFKVKADMCIADYWHDVAGDVEALRSEAFDYGDKNDH